MDDSVTVVLAAVYPFFAGSPLNYLAHARFHLDDPYAVVGTGLPDLVSMADRRNRLKKRMLTPCNNPVARALAEGAHAHFHDDVHFHRAEAFTTLNAKFSAEMRRRSAGEKSRSSVLGHILVEMLLDGVYMEQEPDAALRFEHAWAQVDPVQVVDAIHRWLPRTSVRLPYVMSFFRSARFWHDYLHDEGIAFRLGQVASRIGLGHVPDMSDILPTWRQDVREVSAGLLRRIPMDAPVT